MYGFGVDLGGTTAKVGLFSDQGEMIEKWEIPTDTSDEGSHILPNIAADIRSKITEKGISGQVKGIGIGVPGPVTKDGVVNRCVNLGWGVMNLEQELSAMLGLPVKAGNDANVAALGEAWMGAGKDFSSVMMVTLGTGIGGGLVINDQIVPGAHGAAGEIGHITVKKGEQQKCGCGRYGCIEQYASATGIARLGREHLASSMMDSCLRKIDSDKLTAKDVIDGAKAGDTIATEAFDEAMDLLSGALATISEVANPEAFVIGGGVSKAGDIIVQKLLPQFKAKVFHACSNTKIVLATLGNDAGMYGAVKMVL